MVCEREVILMDDRLGIPRSSRRLEYVMAALPAVPLALYGGAVLVYALVGLFFYPSPEGPLGGLVARADLMHLGPVTGAVLAQPFLVAAAAWIAWIVKTRKTTRVVLL
jgi:branched-subunit amino acid transport protein